MLSDGLGLTRLTGTSTRLFSTARRSAGPWNVASSRAHGHGVVMEQTIVGQLSLSVVLGEVAVLACGAMYLYGTP